MAIVAARFCAALKPLARPAMTMLAASRLTSHSQGPAASRRSRWRRRRAPLRRREQAEVRQVRVAAGLHDDVGAGRRGQVEGHHGRRAAVVGEGRLRHAACRSGTRSGSRSASCASRMAMGSRSGRGSKAAWLVRGTRLRTTRPCSSRTEGWTHGRAVQTSPDGGSGAHAASNVVGVGLLLGTDAISSRPRERVVIPGSSMTAPGPRGGPGSGRRGEPRSVPLRRRPRGPRRSRRRPRPSHPAR